MTLEERYRLWRDRHHPDAPPFQDLSFSEIAHWKREVEPAHNAKLRAKTDEDMRWGFAITLAVIGIIAGSCLWLWLDATMHVQRLSLANLIGCAQGPQKSNAAFVERQWGPQHSPRARTFGAGRD